ncbi:MAG: amidohydrolase family protein [Pseudomonadota bacterium]
MTLRFALFAATVALLPGPAHADALIDNIDGMTLDADGKVVRFRAMTIANGKVTSLIAKRGDKPTVKVDYRIDFKGQTVLPGFVDAHGHVMDLGFRAMSLDLSDSRSLADAQERIRAYAAANPNLRWIRGGGWNQEVWGLGRFPTAAELDVAVADRPVWLDRADGHAAWGNSAALKAAGITAKSVSPAGGRIERSGANPSGVFVDAAQALVAKVIPEPIALERDVALRKAQELLLASGVTAVADMGTSGDDWLAYRRLGDVGGLRIRIMSYAGGLEVASRIAGPGPTPWLYGDRLRMGGVKLYADGALGSRGAWLKADYADAAGQRGAGFLSNAQLKNIMSHAAMNNFQLAVHAIGDAANAEVLGAIDELSGTYTGDRRWRIEHAQIVDPADLPRFAQHGTIASMQPVHQTSDRTMAEARLGPTRLAGAYAWAAMLRGGGRLAFGTDFPVERPDPWAGWAAGFTRQDAAGEPYGGWQPQERLTREQAWKAYTVDAAYAGFADDRFGRLAPGLAADFIVIDGSDPLLMSPSDLRKVKVLQTWVGGEKMFERK